jgi:hypothetical protein
MKEIKFLKVQPIPTQQELLKYAWKRAGELNSTPKGMLIDKSPFKVFVLAPICNDPNIKTYEDVEQLIIETAVDPNTIPDGEVRLDWETQMYIDLIREEEDLYEETVHNEENLPNFYLDKYKIDPWEEDQDRNTEENEINLFYEGE